MKSSFLTIMAAGFLSFGGHVYAEKVSGILEGKEEVTIKAKTQGELMQVMIEEGGAVESGTVLASIDPEQEQIELALAKEELAIAERDYQNAIKLKKYLSQDEIEKKRENYLKKKSALELKSVALKNSQVSAPLSGIVARQYVRPGETVASGDKLFDLVNPAELLVEIDVPADDVTGLTKGGTLPFFVATSPEKIFQGKIEFISPMIDKASGTRRIRLVIKNPKTKQGYALTPGSLVDVELTSQLRSPAGK